jgi:hypothetical protein
MDSNQATIIELLHEAHLNAINEIERLNLRVAELESQDRQDARLPATNPSTERPAHNPPPVPTQPGTGLWNEHEVAAFASGQRRPVHSDNALSWTLALRVLDVPGNAKVIQRDYPPLKLDCLMIELAS